MVHIVMLPFLAQGHFNPFITLADLILHHHPSHTITIVTTPLNVAKLRSMLPPSTPVRLVALPFDPAGHGLPSNGESTEVLPYPLICRLCHASRSLLSSLERLICDLSDVDEHLCLVADIFFGWTVDVARKHGAFHALFLTCSAYGSVSYISLWRHLPQTKTDSDEFTLPDFPDIRLHRTQLSDNVKAATGLDPWSVFLGEEITMSLGTEGLLVNTMEAMEPKGVGRLSTIFPGRPIWCVGPALPSSFLSTDPSKAKSRHGKESSISAENCAEWLHLHPPGSVLYISFGSQNTISASQMKALAMGLEESGVAFIWVVRPPVEFKLDEEFRSSEWLPEGFEERMREKKRGLVVRNWAPQLTILAHESTGGFLSHCGWNSVLESLSHGVPLIGWPIAAEQFYNSKMMEEEMGVAVELARGKQAEVRKEEVVGVVELVMGKTEKREEMRRKAGEVREVLRGAWRKKGDGDNGGKGVGSSLSELNDFIATVSTKRANKLVKNQDTGTTSSSFPFLSTKLRS